MTGSDFEALLRKTGMNRRTMLRVLGGGVASAAAVPLLSACTGASTATTPSTRARRRPPPPPVLRRQRSAASFGCGERGHLRPARVWPATSGGADVQWRHPPVPGRDQAKLGGTVSFGSNASPTPSRRRPTRTCSMRSPRPPPRLGQGEHRRPQLLPGEHQQLPAGQPGRGLHLVRRQPHAVLRRPGPADPDRRRLEPASRASTPMPSPRPPPPPTARSTSCPFDNYPVGLLLPAQRVQGQGLRPFPKTLDELKTLADQDEEPMGSFRSPSPTRTAGPPWARSTT